MDTYSRPYCENCQLIYESQSIYSLSNCTECGKPLTIKSFNPWPKVGGGIALIGGGLAMVFNGLPIIWIGAFIWGGQLLYSAYKQWSQINRLGKTNDSHATQYANAKYKVHGARNSDNKIEDDKNVSITCGACFHRIPVHKGQGIVEIKCPNCGRKSKIRT